MHIIEQDRQLNIESINWQGSEITFAGIESEEQHIKNTDIVPENWQELLATKAEDVEHIFLEYFPPEIEDNFQWLPWPLKEISGTYMERNMRVYSFMTKWAQENKREITCANIATMPRFALYEMCTNREIFKSVEYNEHEQKHPSAINARRVFTATAIRQLISAQSETTSLLYIAAPAHVNRVNRYVQEEQNNRRYKLYNKIFFPLDRNIRNYIYDTNQWRLKDVERIK